MHNSPVPVRQLSESLSVSIIKKSGRSYPCYDKLVQILSNLEPYEHICLSDITPDQSHERYTFIYNFKSGLNIPVVMLTYSPGNNCGNLTFLWRYGDADSVETVFKKSVPVVEIIKPLLPQYHTRVMKGTLFSKFGRVMRGVKPAVLRAFYREISGDCSVSSNVVEADIDKRVELILKMESEDPNTDIDL